MQRLRLRVVISTVCTGKAVATAYQYTSGHVSPWLRNQLGFKTAGLKMHSFTVSVAECRQFPGFGEAAD